MAGRSCSSEAFIGCWRRSFFCDFFDGQFGCGDSDNGRFRRDDPRDCQTVRAVYAVEHRDGQCIGGNFHYDRTRRSGLGPVAGDRHFTERVSVWKTRRRPVCCPRYHFAADPDVWLPLVSRGCLRRKPAVSGCRNAWCCMFLSPCWEFIAACRMLAVASDRASAWERCFSCSWESSRAW